MIWSSALPVSGLSWSKASLIKPYWTVAAKAESLHSRKGTTLWTAAQLNIAFSCLTLRFRIFVQWQLLVAFRNIAYVTDVLVTFKFQQIVRSWYSVQVIFVCTALWTIYLRSNLPNLFKIRRVLRKVWRNTFWWVFYAPQCIVVMSEKEKENVQRKKLRGISISIQ